MAWKMTDRAKAAKVRREWYCDDCEHQWRTVHDAGDDEDYTPECPRCLETGGEVFRPIAIRGTASRALDAAQAMIENDYGLTNARDNLQPGETAFMPPSSIQTAELEAITSGLLAQAGVTEAPSNITEQVREVFHPSMGAQKPNPFGLPTNIEQARAMAAPGAVRSGSADPIALLHAAGKKGLDPVGRQNLKIHSK